MRDPFETLQKLRSLYPEDVDALKEEEDRVYKLLKEQEFASLEVTQQLIAMCRHEIVAARMKLATDHTILGDVDAQRALWEIIGGREWFLKFVSKNYEAELEQIDRELRAELEQ